MRRDTIIFVGGIVLLLSVGYFLGSALASHPKLETFKLLNILGLSLDLLGLIVLSEYVAASEKWKALVVNWIAGILLWTQTVVPLGAAIGAWLNSTSASSSKASAFFVALFVYSLLPLALLDIAVVYPNKLDVADKTQRTRRFGLLLLLSGIVVQIIAAFQDLHA